MDNPVNEIPSVIKLLTQSPPSVQRRTVERYFTPSAAFTHPFCRIWSFNGSRWVIIKIFQWYKIMSPRIDLQIHSVAMDQDNLKLYVTLHQRFAIWLVPFHVSPVTLTTVLDLTADPGDGRNLIDGGKPRYWISKQEDLYQVSEFVKFVIPHIGHFLVFVFHLFATLFCILGTVVFAPVMWLEEKRYLPLRGGGPSYKMDNKMS